MLLAGFVGLCLVLVIVFVDLCLHWLDYGVRLVLWIAVGGCCW